MNVETTAPRSNEEIAQRVRERTRAERKRRIWRNGLFFVAVTIVMLYIALLERDRQAVRNASDIGQRLAQALQDQMQKDGQLPSRVPDLGPRYRLAAAQFIPNAMYAAQSATLSPVAVMHTKQPISLYCRAAGRVVVLFENRAFRSEWMDERVFRERRAALGLGVGSG